MSNRQSIEISKIHIGDRLREVDPIEAQKMALSFGERGQLEDIIIRATSAGKKPYTLVDGATRIAGAELRGDTTIYYRVEKLNQEQARLVEIDANLMRNELTALDRAIFLAERKRIYEALYPETKHGGERGNQFIGGKSRQNEKDFVLAFTDDVAEQLGLGKRSVEMAVQIANNLKPETIKALRGTPEAKNASKLRALARMEPEKQVMAVNIFKETKDLGDAINQAEGKNIKKAPDAELKFATLVTAWKQAPKKSRQKFVDLVKDELQQLLASEG